MAFNNVFISMDEQFHVTTHLAAISKGQCRRISVCSLEKVETEPNSSQSGV